MMRYIATLGLLLASSASPAAQKAPVNWVDGRPMLRVTLRAGEKIYFCHLLIDLSRTEPLFLHANAAGSLRAETVDVEAGPIRLQNLPATSSRDRWLERLTARYAKELNEVPVAGILGVAAFKGYTVVLNGPDRNIHLQSTAAGNASPQPARQSTPDGLLWPHRPSP